MASSTHSLVQRITSSISGRTGISSGVYSAGTYQYDYAIGGVPFLSATSDQRPDTEKGAQQKRDQYDFFRDPGEFSLQQWWLRSQSSFIGGAGVTYQDPDTQDAHLNIRYNRSIGIDPFSDVANAQLLRQVGTLQTITYSGARSINQPMVSYYQNSWQYAPGDAGGATADRLFYASATTVTNYSINATTTALTQQSTVALTGITNIINVGMPIYNLSGTNVCYVADGDPVGGGAGSGVYTVSEAGVQTKVYQAPPTPITAMNLLRGVLYVATADHKLWGLDPTVTNTAWPATPLAQVPNDEIIITIADGPDTIYIGANSRLQAFVYKGTLNSTTGVVNGVARAAVLPEGEFINSMAPYLNTYMIMSTSNGVRVGTFTVTFSGALLQYGPQLISVPRNGGAGYGFNKSGFGKITFYKDKVFIATQGTAQHDGTFGIMAISLATLITDNNTGLKFNPNSTWSFTTATAGPVADITMTSDGRIIYVTNETASNIICGEHSVNLMTTGYLITGRCRFNTIEPKWFKYFSVRTPSPLQGTLNVTLLDDLGGSTSYITYGPNAAPASTDVATPTPDGPHLYQQLKFTFGVSATDPTQGAKLSGWQIKAMPGVIRQRMITRNFLCLNVEKDRTGKIISNDSNSLNRLTLVHNMYQRSDTVILQDLVNNISTLVIIDDYQFTMTSPPGPNSENYGGYLTLSLRTVADAVPNISPQVTPDI